MGATEKTITKQGWVRIGNLQALVLILSHLSAHKLDTYDWDTIVAGIKGTSSDDNLWFYYKLGEKAPIAIKMARDTDERDIIIYNIAAPGALNDRLDLAIYILDDFSLSAQNFPPAHP